MRASFRGFHLDFDQRRLFKGDREIRLAPKALDLLRLLIENRPKAVAKSEIFARLWRDTFVTDNTLATLITDLRSVFGDDASHPTVIRTAYGFGYAFVAELDPAVGTTSGKTSQWTLVFDAREIPLAQGITILGRAGPQVLAVNSATVSRRHARLTVDAEQIMIEDLGSKNGTWVGGAPVSGPIPLQHGAEIRLGSFVLFLSGVAGSTETVERARIPRGAG